MKNLKLLFFITVTFIVIQFHDHINAQNNILARAEKNGKFGCINLKGEEVVPFIYEYMGVFNEGTIAVNKGAIKTNIGHLGGLWGFCDTTGKIVIECKYEDVSEFVKGIAIIEKDSLYGLIDRNDKILVKPQFIAISGFSEGLYNAMNKKHKWGFINCQGKWVIRPRFYSAYRFNDGLSIISIKKRSLSGKPEKPVFGIIDKKGKYILKPKYDWIEPFHEGFAKVGLDSGNTSKVGFINRKGKLVVPVIYEQAQDFYEGLASIGVKDPSPPFDLADSLSRSIFNYPSYKYGYIDTTGKVIINPEYNDYVSNFQDGCAVVTDSRHKIIDTLHSSISINNGTGLIDKSGKKILDFNYAFLHYEKEGIYCAEMKSHYGLIKRNGEIILPFKFNGLLEYMGDDYFVTQNVADDTTVIIRIDGKTMFKIKETNLTDCKYEYGLFKMYGGNWTSSKVGFVDIKGNWVIKPGYDDVSDFLIVSAQSK